MPFKYDKLAVMRDLSQSRRFWEAAMSESDLRSVRWGTRLSHASVRDLQWCARLSSNEHFSRAIWAKVDSRVFTDASMSGWGAAWNGFFPAAEFFDGQHEGSHINELELRVEDSSPPTTSCATSSITRSSAPCRLLPTLRLRSS